MIVSTIRVALATVSLLSNMVSAQIVKEATYTLPMRTEDPKGCFRNIQPLEFHGSYAHQSQGNCHGVCYGLRKATMAMQGGGCWCGDLLPPKEMQVENSKCSTPCPGTADDKCGGASEWTVLTTGYSLNVVQYLPLSKIQTPGQESTSSKIVGDSTIVETITQGGSDQTSSAPLPQPTEDSSSSDDDSGTNVAGIAAGVVVGIVGITAIIGGVYFYLRRRRTKAEEEEKRQQEIVSGFVDGGRKPGTSHSSMNDSRLDPELVRRQSDGSIADNQDYSRRILQVTNPDGY